MPAYNLSSFVLLSNMKGSLGEGGGGYRTKQLGGYAGESFHKLWAGGLDSKCKVLHAIQPCKTDPEPPGDHRCIFQTLQSNVQKTQ